MRKLFILLSFVSLNVSAQDVIVKKDGSTVVCRIVEVKPIEITYKKWSDLKGPNYIMDISLASVLNYEDGRKVVLSEQSQTKPTEGKPSINMATPDSRNYQLINSYNTIHDVQPSYKKTNSSTKNACCIMGIDNNSIISANDFELYMYRSSTWTASFKIMLHNKSNHIIYVDLGNSFKIKRNGKFSMYYDNSQTTVTEGIGSSVGLQVGSVASVLGIGGVLGTIASGLSLGSGNSTTTSTTYTHQRIIAIPPGGIHELETVYYEDIMKWAYNKGEILKGVKNTYNANNSRVTAQIIVSYSDYETFDKISMLNAKLYVREIIGIGNSDMNIGLFDKNSKETMKKSIESIITGYDESYTVIGKFKIE